MVSTVKKPLFPTTTTSTAVVSGSKEDVASTICPVPPVVVESKQRPNSPPQKRRSKLFAPRVKVVEEQQDGEGGGSAPSPAPAPAPEEVEEDSTAQTHYQDNDHDHDHDSRLGTNIRNKSDDDDDDDYDDDRMIDLERGNILKELEELNRNNNGGRTSGNSSVAASLSDQIDQSTGRFWSWYFKSTTNKNGKVMYQYKWLFSVVIILLGSAATTIVLLLGLNGVMKNSEQQFIHEATQLTNVLELSWKGYETLALWVHESCHYNIYESDVQLVQHYGNNNNNTSESSELINSLTEQNLLDDGIALREGFCSRNKFR